MYLISPHTKQYKANLHCHSTMSDGKLSPEEIKDLYKKNGYSILAITDHDYPVDHSALTEPDFLMLTGYESIIYTRIENDPVGVYLPMIHMNLYAKEPHNLAMINYDQRYCFYIPGEKRAVIPFAEESHMREYSIHYINEFVQKAKKNGFLVAYNHPGYNTEPLETLLAYRGFFSMEIANSGCNAISGYEYNGNLYNRLLLSGKRLYCHAADDNHNLDPADSTGWDSLKSWTMIMTDELSYDSVIQAMESGEMYASTGPVFHEVSFDNYHLHIKCSEVEHIRAFFGSNKTVRTLHARNGETVNCADFEIPEQCRYIRVSIEDANGKFADTRGFFRDELGLPPLKEETV